MHSADLEKINRENFKTLMRVLSYPGEIGHITSVFHSYLLSIASNLLYSEVSFFYDGNEEMDLICAIANPKIETCDKADYIFSDSVDVRLLECAKGGSFKDPDFSATVIFCCKNFDGLRVKLTGAGIEKEKEVQLPVDREFIEKFALKNSEYPLGVEIFFINDNGEVMALSRTTKVEMI